TNKERVQSTIKQERIAVAKPGKKRQEGLTYDGVGDPVRRSAECDSEVAARKRVNFRAKNPNDRASAHRKADNEDEQCKNGGIAKLGMLVDSPVKELTDGDEREAHGDKTCIHDRFSTQFVHKRDGDE